MDNKKKRITINDVVDRLDRLENIVTNLALEMREGFKQVNARLDRIEQCPTIKRELEELNSN